MVRVHDNEVVISYIYGNFLLTIYTQVHFHKTVLTCINTCILCYSTIIDMHVLQ